jgi:phage gpG-like protein
MQATVSITMTHNKLPVLLARAPRAVAAAVYATVVEVEREAKLLCPVDTGRLRASIHGQMTGPAQGVVGTNVTYAAPVEYGHVTPNGGYVAGRPYLTPAIEAGRERFRRRLIALLAGEGLL